MVHGPPGTSLYMCEIQTMREFMPPVCRKTTLQKNRPPWNCSLVLKRWGEGTKVESAYRDSLLLGNTFNHFYWISLSTICVEDIWDVFLWTYVMRVSCNLFCFDLFCFQTLSDTFQRQHEWNKWRSVLKTESCWYRLDDLLVFMLYLLKILMQDLFQCWYVSKNCTFKECNNTV